MNGTVTAAVSFLDKLQSLYVIFRYSCTYSGQGSFLQFIL